MQIESADLGWLKVLIGLLTTLVLAVGGALLRLRVSIPAKITALENRLEKKMEERHNENKEEIDSLRESVDKLTAAITGVYGDGGLLLSSRMDQRRRHRLGNQITVLMMQQYNLGIWAGKVGRKIEIEFEPFPMPTNQFEGDDT